ncbi:MAG: manganese efflux pump, partial [Bacillota bacterium]
MDAFAVAMGKGLCMRKIQYGYAAVIALFFGGFQALMPVLGWLLGRQFYAQISFLDHWIAFILLSLIGCKMIYESFKESNRRNIDPMNLSVLLLLSLATSIDALAVGVSFAFLTVSI